MHKKLLLTTLFVFFSSVAAAQAWQWTDENGKKHISDAPPPAGTPNVREIVKHTPPDDLLPEEELAKLNAESDEEFAKRREERLKREEEALRAETEARDKRRACASAKSDLAAKRNTRRSAIPAQRAAKREAIADLEESIEENCY